MHSLEAAGGSVYLTTIVEDKLLLLLLQVNTGATVQSPRRAAVPSVTGDIFQKGIFHGRMICTGMNVNEGTRRNGRLDIDP